MVIRRVLCARPSMEHAGNRLRGYDRRRLCGAIDAEAAMLDFHDDLASVEAPATQVAPHV